VDGQTGNDRPYIGARSVRAHLAAHNAKCFVRKTSSLALILVSFHMWKNGLVEATTIGMFLQKMSVWHRVL
jgi:hypothetical protein